MIELPLGMNWYLAKLVYRIISGDGNHTAQFDVQYRLVRAEEADWALEKAHILGRIGESTFENANRESVRWKFIAVEDVSKIPVLDDGAQLYGQIFELHDPREYVEAARARSQRLLEQDPSMIDNVKPNDLLISA